MVCLDPTLVGRQLVLRKSMIKFNCNSNRKLEVIKWSAPMNMFLNRPFIAILEHHGIKVEVGNKLALSGGYSLFGVSRTGSLLPGARASFKSLETRVFF